MSVAITITLGAESFVAGDLSQDLLNQIGQEATRLVRRQFPRPIKADGVDVDTDDTAVSFTSASAA